MSNSNFNFRKITQEDSENTRSAGLGVYTQFRIFGKFPVYNHKTGSIIFRTDLRGPELAELTKLKTKTEYANKSVQKSDNIKSCEAFGGVLHCAYFAAGIAGTPVPEVRPNLSRID